MSIDEQCDFLLSFYHEILVEHHMRFSRCKMRNIAKWHYNLQLCSEMLIWYTNQSDINNNRNAAEQIKNTWRTIIYNEYEKEDFIFSANRYWYNFCVTCLVWNTMHKYNGNLQVYLLYILIRRLGRYTTNTCKPFSNQCLKSHKNNSID